MQDKVSKGRLYCIISAALLFGSYIIERIIAISFEPSKTLVISQAIIYTICVAFIYVLVLKSKDSFYGILIAIFGIRMMPPEITDIAVFSREADIVYYIVKKFTIILFLIAIVRLYECQRKPRLIKPIPIISILVVVPFVTEIQENIGQYLLSKTGTMLYTYFLYFALYTAAMIVLLFIASRTSKLGAQLICDYQLLALAMNCSRRLIAVIITTCIMGNHISKSYYCWIVIYVFFIIAFTVMKKKRKTNII